MGDIWVVSVVMIVNIVWAVSVRCEGWCVVVSDRGTGPWPDDILGAGTGDDTSYLPGLLNSRREQLMEDGVRRTICLISLPSPWLLLDAWCSPFLTSLYIRFHNIWINKYKRNCDKVSMLFLQGEVDARHILRIL